MRGALRSLFKVEPRTSWLNCRASKPAKATLGALPALVAQHLCDQEGQLQGLAGVQAWVTR